MGPFSPDRPRVYLSTQVLQAKEYLEAIVASTTDAICTTDISGRLIYFSPGAERMLARRAADVVGTPAHALYAGGRAEAFRLMRLLAARGKVSNHETVLLGDGVRVDVSMSIALLRDRRGRPIGTLAISKDIGERVALERRLRELCITDSLTGLYNQRHFQERAGTEVSRALRQGQPLSLVLLDIDRFKEVNDVFGHVEGDRQLRHAADAIQRSIRKDVDLPFRYGGDEFVVLLPGSSAARAAEVARRIQLAALPSPAVSLSAGQASLRKGDDAEALLRRADARMYAEKRRKRTLRLVGIERLAAWSRRPEATLAVTASNFPNFPEIPPLETAFQ